MLQRILSPDFFSYFFEKKSAQKNPTGESPAKSSKMCTTKIPDTFLQRGQANILRIGNGVGKQGYGNRPPIDDRNPIR